MADEIEVIESWEDSLNPPAEDAVVEAEAVEETPATPEPEVEASETPGDDAAAAPKKNKVQERIDELTREKYEWKAKAEALERYGPQGRGDEVKTEPAKTPDLAPTPEPSEDQFDTYADYTKALVQFEARKLVAADRAHQEAQHKQTAYQEWVGKGKTKYQDFSEVAESQAIPYTQAMADAIVGTDTGLDIAYYLGKNPGEATRIAGLSPIQAAKEIGKLEVKLSQPSGKKVSAAAEPIKPVGHGPSVPTDINSIEDDEAWLRAERERLAKQGRLY